MRVNECVWTRECASAEVNGCCREPVKCREYVPGGTLKVKAEKRGRREEERQR